MDKGSNGEITKERRPERMQELERNNTPMSIVSKILGRIVTDRIKRGVDEKLRKEQAGFRKGRELRSNYSYLGTSWDKQ